MSNKKPHLGMILKTLIEKNYDMKMYTLCDQILVDYVKNSKNLTNFDLANISSVRYYISVKKQRKESRLFKKASNIYRKYLDDNTM